MPARKKNKPAKRASVVPSVMWFDFPADDIARAKKFYSKLFGWKFSKSTGPRDYWHISTGGAEASPDGGMLPRQHPTHRGFTNYINVQSVDKAAVKVTRLGGSICMEKTAVPEMGYFVICQDTEGNLFALWEYDKKAAE